MTNAFDHMRLARRVENMKASEIREFLKITERPEIISFAGGLPAPELFPLEAIKKANRAVLDQAGPKALQYATTEGDPALRQWIAERMTRRGVPLDQDNILITSGSQQALDLAGKIFLDEGDIVLCESPTYLAAISAFRAYGCQFVEVETDDHGMLPKALEAACALPGVKMIYMIPDFQNPTGRTWSLERREWLVRLAREKGIPVLEDNPYGDLRYDGLDLPPAQSLDREGWVISTGSFSKIFCPGYRVGWLAGNKDLIRKFVLAKQGLDLHTSTLAQMEIAKYLEMFDIDEHIQLLRTVYKARRDLALSGMEKEFPAGASFTRPQGGLFTWVTLPQDMNARKVLELALKEHVAFVPGGAFFPSSCHENTMRINFSNMSEDRITEGIKRLGRILRQA